MSFLSVFLIAVGLAMDAFAVSIGLGIKDKREKIRLAFKAALLFSVFQMLMPIIGWSLGLGFKDFISSYDHWVAFLLLLLIGVKMIYEGIAPKCKVRQKQETSKTTLFVLAVATSIDALAVGVSFAFLDINIYLSIIVIGLVTFVLSFVGVDLGKRIGCRVQSWAEVFGGLILLLIGLKILVQHFYF